MQLPDSYPVLGIVQAFDAAQVKRKAVFGIASQNDDHHLRFEKRRFGPDRFQVRESVGEIQSKDSEPK